jgi:diguanylate cyclase (GGDEF)-like protein
LLAVTRPRGFERHQLTSWDRARLSIVVPIGVIVAVAIVCIVVAVLSSAQRADGVAVEHEQQLIAGALHNQAEQVLREVKSVAGSGPAIRNIRQQFDADWVQRHVGERLNRFFQHDAVMIFNGQDRPVYSFAERPFDADALEAARRDVMPVLDYMRGRSTMLANIIELNSGSNGSGKVHDQVAAIRNFQGQPAVVAAVAVPGPDVAAAQEDTAPVLLSISLIDQDFLSEIANHLQLKNLRQLGSQPLPSGDAAFVLADVDNNGTTRLAWTPTRPGAEIVNSVWPYIAVALAGFALLAAFVLRYMRRTAVAIAAGESRLRHLAMHDPLCGLPNRIYFSDRLESVIDEVRHGATTAAVFYIDLDHFKDVNDTLGHPVGDELIRNVTLRLSQALRGDDLVARLGGDEFAVVSSTGSDHAKIMMIAQRIIATLCAPYAISKQNIVIGASIGIALIDKTCGGAADVMRYADMALYRAKNEGRNRACIYDSVMDADLAHRKLLEIDLRRTIETDGLQLVYQPLVNASGETLVGVEALCRWPHPVRGDIPPGEFIPIAEHSGLIIELGEWVLRRACLDAMPWSGVAVAVNVSPLQFRRADFVDMVERILRETQFDPSRLELEITESTFIGNVDGAEAAMRRLKSFGVRLALDDFGTGYSSLQYLRRFPFDKLKIDRSFVLSIEKAADAAAIVHAVVSLGRGLGMKVTAEGVETADQHLFLRAAGVHSMQGYRFGRAVSAAEIAERIKSSTLPRKPAALAS